MNEGFFDDDDIFIEIEDEGADLSNLPVLRCLEREGLAESFLRSDGGVASHLTESRMENTSANIV